MRDQFSVSADYEANEQRSFGIGGPAASGYDNQTRAMYGYRRKSLFGVGLILFMLVLFVGTFVLGNFVDITSWLPF